jgi:tRNA A37 methylthiotransferase MiaB
MPRQVDPQARQARAAQIRSIARRSGEAYRSQFLGQTLAVLWETEGSERRWSGLTDNYIRVWAESAEDLSNQVWPTRLTALVPNGARGEVMKGK